MNAIDHRDAIDSRLEAEASALALLTLARRALDHYTAVCLAAECDLATTIEIARGARTDMLRAANLVASASRLVIRTREGVAA